MPSRNIIRLDSSHAYYHVYFRGVNKRNIFIEPADFLRFISIIETLLIPPSRKSKYLYYSQIKLLSFCLMNNHVHFFFYQVDKGALSLLMKTMLVTYTKYFNEKYSRRGPLYESRYKASLIDNEQYLMHISRYIHLNPREWKNYTYSSLRFYTAENIYPPPWIDTSHIKSSFESGAEYYAFVEDYADTMDSLKYISHLLANN